LIHITQIYYQNINPSVFSTLFVKFTTPRNLYANEEVILDMGNDLNDVNTNSEKLAVILKNSDLGDFRLDVAISASNSKMTLIFFNRAQFTASTYLLQINGIRNPSNNLNGYFQIQYIRNFDQALVLFNTQATTATFLPFLSSQSS
jgi:hypothetical protein